MRAEEFIKKWLGNPEKSYCEKDKDEMRSDLHKTLEYLRKSNSIEFILWITENQFEWCWENGSIHYDSPAYDRNFTLDELYDEYLKSK